MKDLLDDLENSLDEEIIPLNTQNINENIHLYNDQQLCDMIICDRYFGLEQKISTICMEELSKRRQNGNIFDFENYIEQNSKDLPELNLEMPDIRDLLNKAIKLKKK